MLKRILRSQLGVTFIEMLGVVTVILVVLGVGTPYVMDAINDSATEDFVSNANALENAVHLYYRDHGEFPKLDEVDTISDKSKKVIKGELLKAGVLDADQVIEKLIADRHLYTLDYSKLKEYTRVNKGDEGTDEFIVVDMVDFEKEKNYGVYENDVAGYIFSKDVRENSNGVVYSGAHKLLSDEEMKRLEDGISKPKYDSAKDMTPYGFRIVNIKNNGDGTADIDLSWTNRVVDDNGDELRGYIIKEFDLTCDKCSETSKILDENTLDYTLKNVPIGVVKLGLQGTRVEFAGTALQDKTKVAYVEGSKDGTIDIIDWLTNPGDNGRVAVDPTLDEVTSGDQYEHRNELYKYLEEDSTFDESRVKATAEGLTIKSVAEGDRIVLKELRKQGNVYDFDKNRTRLFIAKAKDVLIPKDPYLQKDFQLNPSSDYQYIIEVYKNIPCANCSDAKAPQHAVVVYYEK